MNFIIITLITSIMAQNQLYENVPTKIKIVEMSHDNIAFSIGDEYNTQYAPYFSAVGATMSSNENGSKTWMMKKCPVVSQLLASVSGIEIESKYKMFPPVSAGGMTFSSGI
jgi:hypothetical protein